MPRGIRGRWGRWRNGGRRNEIGGSSWPPSWRANRSGAMTSSAMLNWKFIEDGCRRLSHIAQVQSASDTSPALINRNWIPEKSKSAHLWCEAFPRQVVSPRKLLSIFTISENFLIQWQKYCRRTTDSKSITTYDRYGAKREKLSM